MAECSPRFTCYDGPGLKEIGFQQAPSPSEDPPLPLPVSSVLFALLRLHVEKTRKTIPSPLPDAAPFGNDCSLSQLEENDREEGQ